MRVQLSHPTRTLDIKGPKRVKDVLRELNLVVEAHLVIRGDDLVTEDEMLSDHDHIEIRPVISGGSAACPPAGRVPLTSSTWSRSQGSCFQERIDSLHLTLSLRELYNLSLW
jgi:sulfur carrier protein